jgi:hypothetical protein
MMRYTDLKITQNKRKYQDGFIEGAAPARSLSPAAAQKAAAVLGAA